MFALWLVVGLVLGAAFVGLLCGVILSRVAAWRRADEASGSETVASPVRRSSPL